MAQGCAVVYGRGQRGVVLGGVALAAWRARGARGLFRGGRRGGRGAKEEILRQTVVREL